MISGAAKNAGTIVAEIKMLRAANRKAALILEGRSDMNFFALRHHRDKCDLVDAGGRPRVIESVEILDAQKFQGILGIVDDDCQALPSGFSSPNILATPDGRDLEAMLVWSPAFEAVLVERADPVRVSRIGGPSAVRRSLASKARVFGDFRRASSAGGWNLDFDNLKPQRFVDCHWNWKMNQGGLFAVAATMLNESIGNIESTIAALPVVADEFCSQGHDLISTMALGFGPDAILGGRTIGHEDLASALRLAADSSWWNATRLAAGIRQWEGQSPGFVVLP